MNPRTTRRIAYPLSASWWSLLKLYTFAMLKPVIIVVEALR